MHYANSWDHKNEQGQDMVTIYAVTHRDLDLGLPNEHFSSKDSPQTSDLEKFVINLVTGDYQRTKLTENFQCEWPIVHQEMVGEKNRYCYMAMIEEPVKEVPKEGLDDGYFNTLVKYDMLEDKVVKKVSFGETCNGGEVFYAQRDNSSPHEDGEDNGYLMTTVHDW